MNHTLVAFAVLLLAPSFASAAKTEAILAFDDDGSEAVRYYSQSGAERAALQGEPEDKTIPVDAVKGSPRVTAILVSFPGDAAPDKEEVEGKLFAYGDTVNARVRQASGGRRKITGSVVGPVTLEAPVSCDLNQLYEQAVSKTEVDLRKTDVALVIAPKTACKWSGAATLGRRTDGKRRLAVAWVFGEGWVSAASHAIEHSLGTRHAAAPATEDFGWAAATRGSAAARSVKPAAAFAAKPRAKKQKLLTLASVDPMLNDIPVSEGLRDAPAALRPSPAMGLRPQAAMPARQVVENSFTRRAFPTARPVPAKHEPIGAAACQDGARNLRDALRAATTATSRMATLVARRRLAATVKAQEAALAGMDVPRDVEVSLLTTSAETELHVASVRLQSPGLTDRAFKAEVIPAVERAIEDLSQAAKNIR